MGNYELLARNYRKGMGYEEIRELTGLSKNVVYRNKLLRLIKRDLKKERENVAWLLESFILKKAEWGESFVCAYAYSRSYKTYLNFEMICRRCEDLFDGLSNSECAERWGISEPGVCRFRNRVVKYNNF